MFCHYLETTIIHKYFIYNNTKMKKKVYNYIQIHALIITDNCDKNIV